MISLRLWDRRRQDNRNRLGCHGDLDCVVARAQIKQLAEICTLVDRPPRLEDKFWHLFRTPVGESVSVHRNLPAFILFHQLTGGVAQDENKAALAMAKWMRVIPYRALRHIGHRNEDSYGPDDCNLRFSDGIRQGPSFLWRSTLCHGDQHDKGCEFTQKSCHIPASKVVNG